MLDRSTLNSQKKKAVLVCVVAICSLAFFYLRTPHAQLRLRFAEDFNTQVDEPVVFHPEARKTLRWLANAKPVELFKDHACKRSKVVGENYGHWIICEDDAWSDNCLVYSIGIGINWSFDTYMGAQGCEVHGFDPSVKHPQNLAPNVTFHNIGLQTVTEKSPRVQSWTLTFLTLCDMLAVYGHSGRYMDILKIDCEGCEFAALAAFFRGCPHLKTDRIGQLLLELHFDEPGGVRTPADVAQVENVLHDIVELGFRPFWRESEAGPPERRVLISEMSQALDWAQPRMGINIGFVNTRRVPPAKGALSSANSDTK